MKKIEESFKLDLTSTKKALRYTFLIIVGNS